MSTIWISAVVASLIVLCLTPMALAGDKPPKPPSSSSKTTSQPSPQKALAAKARQLVDDFPGKKAQIGISAVDLAGGRKLIAIDDDEMLIPASNQKLVTSAVILAAQGGDFKFTTQAFIYGEKGNDVAVLGDFDPTIGDPYLAAQEGRSIYAELDKWAAAVKDKLGDKPARDVIMFARIRESYRHKDWPQGQADTWYSAPVASLNFHNNCFDVTFRKSGTQLAPEIAPHSRFFKVSNHLKIGSEHAWGLRTSQLDSVLTLTGAISRASDDPVSVAADCPPLLMGRVLAERLLQAGVKIEGDLLLMDEAKFDADQAVAVATTQTTLAAVMARANKRSLNMAAEGMFLRACGDWESGPKVALDLLDKHYGLRGCVQVADGGGLSRNNRISAGAMTALLAGVAGRRDAHVLVQSLPVAGVDGTIQRRLTDEPYKGRVLGKTGWIAAVSTLSGYVLDSERRPAIAYSVLCNGVAGPADAKRLEEAICRLLVDFLDAGARQQAK